MSAQCQNNFHGISNHNSTDNWSIYAIQKICKRYTHVWYCQRLSPIHRNDQRRPHTIWPLFITHISHRSMIRIILIILSMQKITLPIVSIIIMYCFEHSTQISLALSFVLVFVNIENEMEIIVTQFSSIWPINENTNSRPKMSAIYLKKKCPRQSVKGVNSTRLIAAVR